MVVLNKKNLGRMRMVVLNKKKPGKNEDGGFK